MPEILRPLLRLCPLPTPNRFHVFGEGLRSAELHEQTGPTDAVHIDAAFMTALRYTNCSPPVRAPPTMTTTCLDMAIQDGFDGHARAAVTPDDAVCGEPGEATNWLGDLDLWAPYGWISGTSGLATGSPEHAVCRSRVLYPIVVESDPVILHAAV
jgi:hypothetical protein